MNAVSLEFLLHPNDSDSCSTNLDSSSPRHSRARSEAEFGVKVKHVVLCSHFYVVCVPELRGMRACHVRDGAACVKFQCWLEHHLKNHEIPNLDEIGAAVKVSNSLRRLTSLCVDAFGAL